MTRQQKALLLVLGGTAVAGGVAWYVYSTQRAGAGKRAGWVDPSRLASRLAEQAQMRPVALLTAGSEDPEAAARLERARQAYRDLRA